MRCQPARPGRSGGSIGPRRVRGAKAVQAATLSAVYHIDLPAGSRPTIEAFGFESHARRSGPVPEGLHHLHADRQHDVARDTAVRAARAEAAERFGPDHVTDAPRAYANKVRNAQEAHEAIRPAGDHFRHPDTVRGELPKSEADVYEMVWRRTVASQMTESVGKRCVFRWGLIWPRRWWARGPRWRPAEPSFHHQGFRRAYEETREDTGDETKGEAGAACGDRW
ncbi:MAG: hypothetical protein Ct9H300mP12_13190 [Acidimicrobiales bacterium]|nr:MAG: hypothetical protein Ct9H300mP12_13190 [Acidimicrobiales bacterium]